ncbi:MAG TPA: hypothetical protein VKE41_17500, partial [Roseiflexaceae bacterium]|nr:hypothetical protein [Roseiflexaceae bacterium]
MDDLRTMAELAGIDACEARTRTLVLIAAPANSAIVQNDCDCACPASPVSTLPAGVPREHMHLQLHPQARFVEVAEDVGRGLRPLPTSSAGGG